MAVLLVKHPATKGYDLSHVRFLGYGAAPVSAELQEQVVKVIPNAEVGQAYGMTETCGAISFFPPSQRISTPGSAGVFFPGIRARIVKPDGTLAKPGEQGELYVAGPCMALGYYKNEKAYVEFDHVRAQTDELSAGPTRLSSTGGSFPVATWPFSFDNNTMMQMGTEWGRGDA
jgi:acyl-CoA synthetase (AMP-forming)/AMP-acid ligase II